MRFSEVPGELGTVSPLGKGLSEAQLEQFIRERTGNCEALADAWPRSEWVSAHTVQMALRPRVKRPGTFFVKSGIPSWLRVALRRVPLLEASHCAFPAWFAVASPKVDWFALADAQPDLRVTSDQSTGAPSVQSLRDVCHLAAGYTGDLALHVVLAPIAGAVEVEAIVMGVALSGTRDDRSFLSRAIAQRLAFEPSDRLAFTLPRTAEPTLLSWEWGGPFVNTSFGAGDHAVRARRSS